MVFDALYRDGQRLMGRPYRARRGVFEGLFAAGSSPAPLNLCPSITDGSVARQWLEEWAPDNVEGLL